MKRILPASFTFCLVLHGLLQTAPAQAPAPARTRPASATRQDRVGEVATRIPEVPEKVPPAG